jgi:hypothetical protein
MSPNLNAYAERCVRLIKDEWLGRMIFLGQASLRRAIGEFMSHYHTERNHQGLANRLIRPQSQEMATTVRSAVGSGWEECSTTTIARPHEFNRVFGHYAVVRHGSAECSVTTIVLLRSI